METGLPQGRIVFARRNLSLAICNFSGVIMTDTPHSIHGGHRQRMKQRYLDEGLASFSEHQVLEMLLYFGLPRGDTNELAHQLIERYGSLPAVLDADYEDLRQMSGVGGHTALLLSLMPQLWRYYQLARGLPRDVIHQRRDLAEYAVNLFIGQANERCYLICLDARNNVIRAVSISEGVLDNVGLEPRAVAEAALRYKAKSIVLAHNHPGGSLKPSAADISLTKQLTVALAALDITVLDHIIVANGEHLSFFDKGLM
jgi:DNA repair protein RadC